jgi:hypothetical protein
MKDILIISTNNYTRTGEVLSIARDRRLPVLEVDNRQSLNNVNN